MTMFEFFFDTLDTPSALKSHLGHDPGDSIKIPSDMFHTGQCKRTGGCYNELVVAFYSTGGGVKCKKSIPVDFIIHL